MENSKLNIIKEIAEQLHCGNDCYYDPETDEIIAIPNFEQSWAQDDFLDAFSVELEKIEENEERFIRIEVLEDFEAFKIMERFVAQIPDRYFQAKLENILQRKKPFKNFKTEIDNSDYRQDWFDFKHSQLERIVEIRIRLGKEARGTP